MRILNETSQDRYSLGSIFGEEAFYDVVTFIISWLVVAEFRIPEFEQQTNKQNIIIRESEERTKNHVKTEDQLNF